MPKLVATAISNTHTIDDTSFRKPIVIGPPGAGAQSFYMSEEAWLRIKAQLDAQVAMVPARMSYVITEDSTLDAEEDLLISLPNNANEKFLIEGVAVDSTVTAANMKAVMGALSGSTAAALTMVAGCSLAGAAGAGAVDFHLMTGNFQFPTGTVGWAGAAGKAMSLIATTAAVTITAGATSIWSTAVGNLTLDAAGILLLGPTAATSVVVGRSGQSLGFYGTTGVAKQVAAANVTGFVAGSGTASKSDSTWDGATGSSHYTVGDIVTALKAYGLLTA